MLKFNHLKIKGGSLIPLILFVVIIIFLDQLTKYLALSFLAYNTGVTVVPGLFNLTLVYNKGAAFGLFASLPDGWREIVLFSVSALALLGLFLYAFLEKHTNIQSNLAIAAIIAGAIGNIIDRIRNGYVVDFFDFYIGNYHWPAFNIADSAISIGVIYLLLASFNFRTSKNS